MSNPNPGFGPESWSLYSVGAALCIVRLGARIKRMGIGGLQPDDYLVAFGLMWYTLLCVAFNEMLVGAGSNLMTQADIDALTPEIKAERIRGSKWVFVSEHAMLFTIWSMKAAMLVFYSRLIEGLPHLRKWLNFLVVWVICGFVGDLLALFLICRPLKQYWAVPVNDSQCASYQYYQIVNAVFNISTDILILAIGIPPVLTARLSKTQKAVLGIVFGMGGFVIVAAILRAIYCLVPSLVSYVYMNWYFREAAVSVYVTNLPSIWTFLRETFPIVARLTTRRSRGTNSRSKQQQQYTWGNTKGSRGNRLDESYADMDLDTYPISKSAITTTEVELERGIGDGSSTSSRQRYGGQHNEIRRDVTFTVEHLPKEETILAIPR